MNPRTMHRLRIVWNGGTSEYGERSGCVWEQTDLDLQLLETGYIDGLWRVLVIRLDVPSIRAYLTVVSQPVAEARVDQLLGRKALYSKRTQSRRV